MSTKEHLMPDTGQGSIQLSMGHAGANKRRDVSKAFRRFTGNTGAVIGFTFIVVILLMAALSPLIQSHDPYKIDYVGTFLPPSSSHIMGTDELGRDIWSRVVEGTRLSLKVVVYVLSIAVSVGVIIGLISGYADGVVDEILMRVGDVFLAFPSFLLAMAIVASLGPGLDNAAIAIGIAWWPRYARLLRGQVFSIKREQYVEAATALGASRNLIMFRHILPNSYSPVLIQAASDAGSAIILTASLSFVGLGANPPTAEWGAMIATGRSFMMSYWWVGTFPGIAIVLACTGFMMLGDGLRDLFDPKLRGR